MAKYSGYLGLLLPEVETVPGVWKPSEVKEVKVKGDTLNQSKNYNTVDTGTNDYITVSKRVSIVASSDLIQNSGYIRYASYLGSLWKVVEISYERPRLILTLGGLWNGPVPDKETTISRGTN